MVMVSTDERYLRNTKSKTQMMSGKRFPHYYFMTWVETYLSFYRRNSPESSQIYGMYKESTSLKFTDPLLLE